MKDFIIGAVVPAYKCKAQIEAVLKSIPKQVKYIYVIDDACPEGTGDFVESRKTNRVKVLRNKQNLGVGGAVVNGFKKALSDGCDIVVKIDGDGQMDPLFIPTLISPILSGEADYAKGNRFYLPRFLIKMPIIRLIGNAFLSMINKLVTGYWSIFDPTNGFTAIHKSALSMIELDKVSKDYFFESDMLFRLSIVRAVVVDVPMSAHYGSESSSLNIGRVLRTFPIRYINRLLKRILYIYFIRDFSVGSLALLAGLIMSVGGLTFGLYNWAINASQGNFTPTGTIMLAVLLVVVGVQAIVFFLQYDISQMPQRPLQRNYEYIKLLTQTWEKDEQVL